MATVPVTTRITRELNRIYYELSLRLGIPVSRIRAEVLEDPEWKLKYDIKEVVEERDELKKEVEGLRVKNEEQERIINEGINKVRLNQKQFNKLVLDFLDIDEDAIDSLIDGGEV